MSEGCEYDYFTRPAGWRVTETTGPNEEVGHILRIHGHADNVTVECRNDPGRHPLYKGKHNPKFDRIEGQGWTITGNPGNHPAEDQIKYESAGPTGSWTADDNGGDEGG
jgi:hypothetical protein